MAHGDAFDEHDDLDFSADHSHGGALAHEEVVLDAEPAAQEAGTDTPPRGKQRSALSRAVPLLGLVVLVGGVATVIVPKALHMRARTPASTHAFHPEALAHLGGAKQPPAAQAAGLLPGAAAPGQQPQVASSGFAIPAAPVASHGSAPAQQQSFLAPAPAPSVVAQTPVAPLSQQGPSDAAEDAQVKQLSSQVAALNDQVATLTARLNDMTLAQRHDKEVVPVRPSVAHPHPRRVAVEWSHERRTAAPIHPHAAPAVASLRDYSVKATYPGAGRDVRAWISGPHGLVESVGVGSDVGGARVLHIDAQDLRVETTRGTIIAAGLQ